MKKEMYDLVEITIAEIQAMREHIKEESVKKTKAGEKTILNRLSKQFKQQFLYVLIAEPNDEPSTRCTSPNYEDLLQHMVEVEIFHYYENDQQPTAIAKVEQLANCRPIEGKPLYFELPESYGLYPYMIQCISCKAFIEQLEHVLKSKDEHRTNLSRRDYNDDD